MPTIIVSHLSKYYRVHQKEPGLVGSVKSLFARKYYDVKAVNDVSFEIEEGELVGFIGPNGAGKTTTLKTLSGLLYPTRGEVSVLGHIPWKREAVFQKQFALVMGQKNQLWWDLPAIESFILNKEIYEVPDEQYRMTLNELSELLEVQDLLKVQVRKLSLGERMKMELIAALIHSPRVLFLDEPTIGLDVVAQKKMRDFIKVYNLKYKSTIILTSHYMDDVKELCKRVIIIDKGKVLFDGQLAQIVRQFADHKILSVVLEKELSRKQVESLAKLGGVRELEFPKLVLEVPREHSNKVAAKLLSAYPVADLNIEEPAIEDIIREVFTGRDIS
ncbi:MAG: ABC transporter ATP-binding protein [Patescibacteria group bacterium]|nr:ABC transporter ATP-binding protein [Patescibacteria group bacterium]MCL5431817.1 ABC transporter ATP-binding protein [Patescibacteria group bacterium]